MNESLLLSLLIFAGLLLVVFSGYLVSKAWVERRRIVEKIEREGASDSQVVSPGDASEPAGAFRQFFIDLTTRLGRYSAPKGEEELGHRKKKLIVAGYRKSNAPIIFYGIKILLAIVLPAAVFLSLLFLGIPVRKMALLILLLTMALSGFYAPDAWVRLAIARRQEKITDGFPDALDMMVVCVEAGMGLDQAIKRVSDEMKLNYRVISDEFGLMNLELRAGRSRQDALRNLVARTDVEDVKSLVTLLIQTDKFGTSIAQALRVHSDSMRTKRRQRAEERAMKLPVKLLFPLILFIFPALFVAIIGPGAIQIYRSLIQGGLRGGG
jgi:tight adherence protein C